MKRPKPIPCLRPLLAAIAVLLVAGCDQRGDTRGAIGDFIASFARSALAAFLL